MPQTMPRAKRMAFALAGSAAFTLGLTSGNGTAHAMPLVTAGTHTSIVEPVRIYRRGRTPIYPYYYNPGRPGGYSFYFGFVPYPKGNIENQAIQRSLYPQNIEWPPDVPGPHPGWGPKASD